MTDGVVVVDKPAGPTSHDVVIQARRVFDNRAVGHAGTLDPMASGVLLLLVGEARKLSGYLAAADKEYRAEVTFGRSTDSFDAEGTTVSRTELEPGWLTVESLGRALAVERARTRQRPPAVSAIKIAGVRAYRKSRRGEPVEIPERSVRVAELKPVAVHDAAVTLEMRVSKGYYVRALARDLGKTLGVPAHLSALRRLASGRFVLAEAVPWPPSHAPVPIPLARAAARAMPTATLTDRGVARARHGRFLERGDFEGPEPTGTSGDVAAWLGPDGRLVALGTATSEREYRVVRGFSGNAAP